MAARARGASGLSCLKRPAGIEVQQGDAVLRGPFYFLAIAVLRLGLGEQEFIAQLNEEGQPEMSREFVPGQGADGDYRG